MFVGNATTGSHLTTVTLTVLLPPDFALTSSTSGLIISSGSSATSTIFIAPIHGFTGSVALSTNAPGGITGTFSPNPVLGGTGTSTLTLSVASTVAEGNYTVTVVGTGGSFTHTVSFPVIVSSTSTVTLTETHVSWAHRVSLSKNNGAESWTLTVANTGQSPAYIQVIAAGNATSSGLFFTVKTSVTLLGAGASLTITLSQPLTSTSIGQKYNFTLNLLYGSGLNASGSIINPSSIIVTKGTFTIVR